MKSKTLMCLLCLLVVMLMGFGFHMEAGIGIKAGFNLANMSDLDEGMMVDMGSRKGAVAGIFYCHKLSKSFYIQSEILYSMKGAEASGTETRFGLSFAYDYKLKMDYFEVPILAKIKIPSKGNVAPNFFAGPYVAFKSKAEMHVYENLGDILIAEVESQELEGIKSTDFGVVFGGGLDYKTGSGNLILDLRYVLGLSKIDDTGYSRRNSNISLTVGFEFN
ncbi:MAG: PorT family protein [bacterium]|nr:PorT family protein [bacterium]